MADCHNLFIEFDEIIKLSSSKKASLRTSRNALREKITNDFSSDEDYTPKYYGQGSFSLKTIINPLESGAYDIDDGIYFEVTEEPKDTPAQFHAWIMKAIDGYTNNIIDKNPCIRVIFSDGHHIDLTIYYIITGQSPKLAHKKRGWIESDPREFMEWFNEKLDDDCQLRRIVKYLKAWCDNKKLPLSGLVLTILAAENYSQDKRDDKSFLQTIKNIHSKLNFNFVCYRPTTPKWENLIDGISQTNKENFLNAIESFITSGDQAMEEPNQKNACIKWKKHFGDRFPCSMAEDLLEEAKKFGSPAFINTDGRSA